jgi:hypothetical protein
MWNPSMFSIGILFARVRMRKDICGTPNLAIPNNSSMFPLRTTRHAKSKISSGRASTQGQTSQPSMWTVFFFPFFVGALLSVVIFESVDHLTDFGGGIAVIGHFVSRMQNSGEMKTVIRAVESCAVPVVRKVLCMLG